MKSTPKPSASPASPAPKFFGSLRPDPSSLFNRASVTTVALASAFVLTGSADAQAPATDAAAKAAAAKKNAAAGGETVEVTLSEVVVAAQPETYKAEFLESPKYTAPILNTPQSISVITQEVIKDQNATTLRDVLRNVPGITAQAGEGGAPGGDMLSIRGFSARNDMFVDGIRDIGGYTRDPFNYEQIEVAKGPSSTQNGRGSTGGSINLASKTPNLERSYAGSAGIGTDQYVRLTLDLNQPLASIPGAAIRLNALFQDADVAGRDFVGNSRWGIAPSIAFGLGSETRVTLSYLHLDQDNQTDNGIPWVPATNTALPDRVNRPATDDYSTYYGLTGRDQERTQTDLVTLEFEHDFTDEMTLRNVFRYGRNDRDGVTTSPRFNSNTSTDIKREYKAHDRVTQIFADSLSLRSKFDTWNFSHTSDIGIDYAHETEVSRSRNTSVSRLNGPLTSLNNPDAQDKPYPYLPSGPWTGAYTETKSDTIGIFLFDTVKLHEKLELTGGVRWEHFSFDHTTVPVPGSATGGVPNKTTTLSSSDDFLSWRIGPVFKPVENGSIYFSFANSFSPSAEGVGVGLSANNAALAPEESRTFEVGTKWDFFENRLSLTGAIFRIEKTNARTDNLDPADPQQVLEGEQRVDGIELGISGSITPEWKIFTGFTYLNSEIVKSNDPLEVGKWMPNTPETAFSLWTTYELPWNITLGGGAQYVGSRFNDAANMRRVDAYWLFDAMASYKISENVTAQINVNNITDEQYIDRTAGGHFAPGVGRTATLTFNFKF